MTLLASTAFFLSGFAALLYQVSWQRTLAIFSGADVYSATLIVAAFMGGLGVGSLAGGHVADRVAPRTALLLFATAELSIAVFAWFSPSLYYGFLYRQLGPVSVPPAAMAGLLFGSLLWPTFFMGASLPLLARALAHKLERAASIIGVLYGVNTLGAAAGALISTWWLLPKLGLEASVQVGAVLNVVCAVVLLPLAVALKRPAASGIAGGSVEATPPSEPRATPSFSLGTWFAVFALSGLLALGFEIVWFRLLGVMMKSTAFTFGTLLALYLTGIGLGALAGSVLAPRVRSPATVFLGLQAAVAVTACGLLAILLRSVDGLPEIWNYLGSYEPLSVREQVARLGGALTGSTTVPWPSTFLLMYLVVPAALVLPPTLLMGCSFPLLQRVVQTDLNRVGRHIGALMVANIVGSMAGTALTGFVLLDHFGTGGTLRLLSAVSALFAALAITLLRRSTSASGRPARVAAMAGASAVLYAVVILAIPGTKALWTSLHGATERQVIFGEDGSGVSVVKTDGSSAIVFVNGVGQSAMPYGGVHTALGALPAFIHPAPRTAAIIGLGSGDTVHAAGGRRDLESITCIEIIGAQVDTLRALDAVWGYAGLKQLLTDPRIRHVAGDGRIHLMRGSARYDLIEADALRPSSAYSGNLYSEAYFTLVRDSLNPGGLAASWAPTPRVHDAFVRVFPYVVSVPGILIGSQSPISLDRTAISARLAATGVREYYAAAGIAIEEMFAEYLAAPASYGPDTPRAGPEDVNTDLFPKDEFDLSPP